MYRDGFNKLIEKSKNVKSQYDLCRRLGITTSNLTPMLTGKHRPTTERLLNIANIMGLDYRELIELFYGSLVKENERVLADERLYYIKGESSRRKGGTRLYNTHEVYEAIGFVSDPELYGYTLYDSGSATDSASGS